MRCLALALTFATGCSFFFVDGPPATPNARPYCTTSKGIPASAVDTPGLSSDDRSNLTLVAVAGLLSSAGHYLAAISGNSDVNRCREAQARWDSGR